uniref:Uncharacterized protein n=1 Tax=Arundo donax TaxID=35708 RepID=A0A0A9GA82_ARUDO
MLFLLISRVPGKHLQKQMVHIQVFLGSMGYQAELILGTMTAGNLPG